MKKIQPELTLEDARRQAVDVFLLIDDKDEGSAPACKCQLLVHVMLTWQQSSCRHLSGLSCLPMQGRDSMSLLCRHLSMGSGDSCLRQQTDCIPQPSPRPARPCLKLPAKLLCCAAAEPWTLTSSGTSCGATACSQTPPSPSMLTTW